MFRLLFMFIFFPTVCFPQFISGPHGGEHKITQETACISELSRVKVKKDIQSNIGILKAQGKLQNSNQRAIVSFDFPLQMVDNDLYINYYGISNYVDHNPAATGSQYGASNLDYHCGNRTYDTASGYNHQGIDFTTWPFPWDMFENDVVSVVAAEGGLIVAKYDGNFDQNCSCVNSQSNSVHVQHADGSQSWYWHLKENSLTTKSIGDSVAKGEFLGVVGSSGCSTTPHLHFEVYDSNGQLIDPYAGDCNSLNTSTWWTDQAEYEEPTLNALLTHSDLPVFGCTSSVERTYFKNCFNPGETVYMVYYYTDQLASMNTHLSIIQPDGTVFAEWDHASDQFYTFSYWYWQFTPTIDFPEGIWHIGGVFDGKSYTYPFYFGTDECDCPIEYSAANGNRLTGMNAMDASFESTGRIESNQILQGNTMVNYDSGRDILLQSTFEVMPGVTFTAIIDGCGGI